VEANHSNLTHPESGIKLEGPWRPDQVERIRAFADKVKGEPIPLAVQEAFKGFQEWADGEIEY
jgi:hypothetical protein